ncbi:hypothetical protein C2S53_005395 [Perilla frutescens var. hirtella]|uniref:Ubiquitin-like protease family profile domain-containing protein n=1 Tax=Perilla frutescens var. hirtella TaxID=608512 RepID=A0AAD4PBT4_PERFH|nr:hypothetical protein C2S53_005395 [Perilla frutescens var. hirtella]
MQVSSAKDKNPIESNMKYYGIIDEIWAFDYHIFQVIMFKCTWVDDNNGVEHDDLGYALVNLTKVGYKTDSFILGSHATQVFYVEDPEDPEKSVVLTIPSKEYTEYINDDELGEILIHHPCFTFLCLNRFVKNMDESKTNDIGMESKDTQLTKSTRGNVNLGRLSSRRVKGIKQVVDFNKHGQPIGQVGTEMQSYIGMLARKEVKITYKSWKVVPNEVKDTIWELVNLAYTVDPKWKTGCLESANTKWRQWKTTVFNKFNEPYKNDTDKLKLPPPKSNIFQEDWSQFIISRMFDEFKDEYIRQKENGEFKSQDRYEDLLTQVLEKSEHPGHVRAIGRSVTPTTYFNHPRERRQGIYKDHLQELLDAKKLIKEQDLCISELKTNMGEAYARLGKLEAMFLSMSPMDKVQDEKGSCSVMLQHSKGKSVALIAESTNDVIAYGTIVSVDEKTLHGRSMPKNCYRVSIDEAIDPNASLPFPIPDVCDNVGDAIGTHVAWPYSLVVAQDKMVHSYAQHVLANGKGVFIDLDDGVFGHQCDFYVHFEDINPFCLLEPISGNCILVYICEHWILTVIEPHKEVVYLLDLLSHRIRDDWRYVVNIAMRLFNASLGKKGKTQPTWEIIKGPRQPDNKQCGYYVMRYMREIVQEFKANDVNSIRSLFEEKGVYSQEDIDEVRSEWAHCLQDHVQ